MTWLVDDEEAAFTRLTDLVTPMAVRVAATLRLADHVAKGTTSIAELAQEVGANTDVLHRLLRYLAVRGVFTFSSPNHVTLTGAAEILRSEHPRNMRAALDIEGALGRADLALIELLHVARTGEPGYLRRYGSGFWDDLENSHELTASFDALMSNSGRPTSPLPLLLTLDWSDTTHLFDIGGGNGNTLVRLLEANPHLRGTLVDRTATAMTARTNIAEADLDDRCDVIARSFFDTLPTGGDTYLLSLILHDWADGDAELILRQCARAAGPGGRVLIGDLLDGDSDAQLVTHFDLRMLTYFAARERDLDDFHALTDATGLTITSVARTEQGRAAVLDCRVTA